MGLFESAGKAASGYLAAGVGAAQAVVGMLGMKKKKKAVSEAIDSMETYAPSQEIMGEYSAAKTKATGGLSGSAKTLYQQGSQQAMASGLNSATSRKGGLTAAGAIAGQAEKGALQLAVQEDQAKKANEATRRQMASAVAGEKSKAFQSRQQKQQLKTNIALQELAAQRAMISQGLGAVGRGLTAASFSGEGNPFSGMFKKKKTSNLDEVNAFGE